MTQNEMLIKLDSSEYIKFDINGSNYYFKIIENFNKTRYRLVGFNLFSKLIYNPILYVNENDLTLMYDESNTMYCNRNVLYRLPFNDIVIVTKEIIKNELTLIDSDFSLDIKNNLKIKEYLPTNLPIRYNDTEKNKLKERLSNGEFFIFNLFSIFRYNSNDNILEVFELSENILIYGEYDFEYILSSDPNEGFGIQITKEEFEKILNNMYQTNLNYLKGLLE
jgi:hypothetical protein